ncbi:MAG: GxxExxY protein [Verrucomicrobia bacterium]|nr:GxxExxY protein [Verrucomicrobiota bacterium]
MADSLAEQLGYDFMAAAFAVYNELGVGFTEDIYQEALGRELVSRSIAHVAQSEVILEYRGQPLNKRLRPDLIIGDQIIVELKAATAIVPEHEAQLFNYLKATRKRVGYLVNFGSRDRLQWKRFIRPQKD